VKQESVLTDEQRQAAKKRMVTLMQEGHPWREAARLSGIQTSRSTAYRWFQQFRTLRCGGLAGWEARTHRQDVPAHPRVA